MPRKITDLHPLPWRVEYDIDVGDVDGGFWKWWEIRDANGKLIAKCFTEEVAAALIAAVKE